MKKLIILLPFLLIQLVSLSQTDTLTNGQIIRTDSTTFYIFDSVTIDTLVRDLIRGDECKEEKDSLNSIIKSQYETNILQRKTISELKVENKLLSEIKSEKDSLYKLKSAENLDCQKEKNKLETKNKLNKIGAWILGGTTLFEGIVIVTLLVKQ